MLKKIILPSKLNESKIINLQYIPDLHVSTEKRGDHSLASRSCLPTPTYSPHRAILSSLRSLNSISKPSLQSCAFISRCTCPTACSTFPPAGPTDTALPPNSLLSGPLHHVNGNASGAHVIKLCHPRLPSSFFCLHSVIKSYKSCFQKHSEFTDFLPLCVMPMVQPMDLSLLGSYT